MIASASDNLQDLKQPHYWVTCSRLFPLSEGGPNDVCDHEGQALVCLRKNKNGGIICMQITYTSQISYAPWDLQHPAAAAADDDDDDMMDSNESIFSSGILKTLKLLSYSPDQIYVCTKKQLKGLNLW